MKNNFRYSIIILLIVLLMAQCHNDVSKISDLLELKNDFRREKDIQIIYTSKIDTMLNIINFYDKHLKDNKWIKIDDSGEFSNESTNNR